MFKCDFCGEVFDTPAKIAEDRGEFWGIPCYEIIYVCPGCGSDAYDEYDEDEEDDDVWE